MGIELDTSKDNMDSLHTVGSLHTADNPRSHHTLRILRNNLHQETRHSLTIIQQDPLKMVRQSHRNRSRNLRFGVHLRIHRDYYYDNL